VAKDSTAGTPGRSRDAADALLGRQALREGLITADQLKEALAEQARDLGRKRQVRPLRDILQAGGS